MNKFQLLQKLEKSIGCEHDWELMYKCNLIQDCFSFYYDENYDNEIFYLITTWKNEKIAISIYFDNPLIMSVSEGQEYISKYFEDDSYESILYYMLKDESIIGIVFDEYRIVSDVFYYSFIYANQNLSHYLFISNGIMSDEEFMLQQIRKIKLSELELK